MGKVKAHARGQEANSFFNDRASGQTSSHLWFILPSCLIPLMCYLLTASHTVTMEDSGEFISSAFHWGIPHPPGYPLFTMLAHLFTYLPLGTIAYRVHIFDSLVASMACAALYFIAFRLTRHQLAAATTALAFGLSQTLWSQAIIAEVYALNALLYLVLFWLGLKLDEAYSRRTLMWGGFVFGLGLANSWPLLLLASPALLCFLWPQRREVIRDSGYLLAMVGVGLFPYGVLIVRSHFPLELAFNGPIQGLADLWQYVTRRDYADADVQSYVTWLDTLKLLLFFGRQLFWEFSPLGFLVAGAGAVVAWQKLPRRHTCALLLAFLSSSVFLLLNWRNEYNVLTAQVYQVFHQIPFAVVALLIGFAIAVLANQRKALALATASVVLLAALVLNFRQNNMRDDTFPIDVSALTLKHLPAKSVLILWSDEDSPFSYARFVLNMRADVLMTSQFGVTYPEKMFDRRARLTERKKIPVMVQYIQDKLNAGYRVFTTHPLYFQETATEMPFQSIRYGLFDELTLQAGPPVLDADLLKEAKDILDRVARKERTTDFWSFYRDHLIRRLCYTVALHKQEHPLFATHFDCRMGWAHELYEVEKDYRKNDEVLLGTMKLTSFRPLSDQNELYRLWLINRVFLINGSPVTGLEKRQLYQNAVDTVRPFLPRYPVCENTVVLSVLEIANQAHVAVDSGFIRSTFGRCAPHKNFIK